jgi:tetratricopeptide (TPR) repeat protein
VGLALLTLLAFEGVRRCGFVAYDDDIYLYRNPLVRYGFSAAGLRWAWSAELLYDSPYADNWMPPVWVSHTLVFQLFGTNPAAHHLANLALHVLSVALLFLFLDAATGARLRSAFVAAAFAVHPLTVESVAWVTERKDVLSGAFCMLTLVAYREYARSGQRRHLYAAVLAFALGLLSKPMLVTLPLVLLLLDRWPLGRAEVPLARLVREKWPLFALSAAASVTTLLAHNRDRHLPSFEDLPLGLRLANALSSLVAYLRSVLWPSELAVFYPYALSGALAAAAALFVLGSVTLGAAHWRRSRPYLIVGWLWFLVMLLPVIGLIQAGGQARADRYMYLPIVGLALAGTWALCDVLAPTRHGRVVLGLLAAVALASWTLITRAQVRVWRDTVTLFSHALKVTRDNSLAHYNLARALELRGDMAGAERHYREAIRAGSMPLALRPGYPEARTSLAALLTRTARLDEARQIYAEMLQEDPRTAAAYLGLGLLDARQGRPDQAADHYAQALLQNPDLALAHYNWGNLLLAQRRFGEAESHYAQALEREPDEIEYLNNLGLVRGLQGDWQRALPVLERAVSIDPNHARARTSLAQALLALGRAPEAVEEARGALKLDFRSIDARLYLGRALLAAGRREESRTILEDAARLAPRDPEVAAALQEASRQR